MRILDLKGNTILEIDSLTGAYLTGAELTGVDLTGAYLTGADLTEANLTRADLYEADLTEANLTRADLYEADLTEANLTRADLTEANLTRAKLTGADLTDSKGLIKIIGVMPGNCYWKRFGDGLENGGYQFKIGINKLRKGEKFASDERIMCSYPGFHFASRSWCAVNYGKRKLEALIRIPEGAQINEPWATDGKASADMIEILQVFNVDTGEDVTHQFDKSEDIL